MMLWYGHTIQCACDHIQLDLLPLCRINAYHLNMHWGNVDVLWKKNSDSNLLMNKCRV